MELYYHYTTLATLQSIVKDRKWRLTNIGFMNDGNEFHYAWGLAKDALGLAKDFVLDLQDIPLRGQILPYWVTCFSKLPDSFAQWGLYGDKGAGVAIGVEVQNIQNSIDRIGTSNESSSFFDQAGVIYRISYRSKE